MKIQSETVGTINVIRPSGKIDNANARAFERAIQTAIDRNGPTMILDFSLLNHISSAGLRSTLGASQRLQRDAAGRMVICAPGSQVRGMLETCGMLPLFAVCSDLEASLQMLQHGNDTEMCS